ncbi:MAG: hypothetical protein AVDCRST_MAG57-1385, partial [uncultured Blastococcus sp.]
DHGRQRDAGRRRDDPRRGAARGRHRPGDGAARADRGLGHDHRGLRRGPGRRGAGPLGDRAASSGPAHRRPAPRTGRPGHRTPGVQPGHRHRQRAGPAAVRPPRRGRRLRRGDPGRGLRGSTQLRARRDELPVHGPDAGLRRRGRGSLGHDGAPGAGLPRPAAAGDATGPARLGGRERGPQVADHRHDRPGLRPRAGARRGARSVRDAPPGEAGDLLRVDHRRRRPAHPAQPAGRRHRPPRACL